MIVNVYNLEVIGENIFHRGQECLKVDILFWQVPSRQFLLSIGFMNCNCFSHLQNCSLQAALCCTEKDHREELHRQTKKMGSGLFPREDMVMEGKEYKQKLALQKSEAHMSQKVHQKTRCTKGHKSYNFRLKCCKKHLRDAKYRESDST